MLPFTVKKLGKTLGFGGLLPASLQAPSAVAGSGFPLLRVPRPKSAALEQ